MAKQTHPKITPVAATPKAGKVTNKASTILSKRASSPPAPTTKLTIANAAAKPKSTGSPPTKPQNKSTPAKAQPSPNPSPSATDVDPLMGVTDDSLRLIGGLERSAQLPTTLVPRAALPQAVPLTVHAQAVPGMAHHGNTQPANILVLVSCGGWPVVDLNEDHFSIMEHFEVPGQSAPFSNNITSFRNNGSGSYLLQVRPICQAPWASGQHLAQVLVSSPDERHGQTAVKLIIR
jgi:hypothetical protein